MSVIATILPFAILIILLVGLYIFQGYAYHKGLKWVFGTFMTILLLSTIVYYFLPENFDDKRMLLTHQERLKVEDTLENFYLAFDEGKLDSVDGVIAKEQWKFNYSGDSLEIPDNERLNMLTLLVERKENNDNKIEVVHYMTKHIVGQNDYTDKLDSPSVLLEGDLLKVTPPEEKIINISSFKKDFVVTQFEGDRKEDESYSFPHINGEQVIYIKIPNNVQITSNNFIQYVGEEF